MSVFSIVSLVLGVLLLVGFFIGFVRSWKKSLIRFALFVVSFLLAMVFSGSLSNLLMTKFVDGLILSIFGLTIDFEEIVGDIAGDLLGEGSAMTNFATALMNVVIKLLAFLVLFIVLMIITLIIYYIIVAVISSREKKKSIGKVKPKIWEKFIGGFIGIVSSLVICLALFTPVFGVMNVCDKFLENDNGASAYASEQSFVAGKFYTEDENIGKVETYLQKYEGLRTEYKKSFAGIMFTYTGVDALGKATFDNLSTVNKNGLKLNLTNECVNLINVYNIYKDNFLESKFDLSTNKSVEALQDIYNIAKKSEVLRSFIVDLVPKMASKWVNGEEFLGMEMPVTGDAKDIAIEILSVFNTDDFEIIDENINVLFDSIRIANNYDVISDINSGSEILDVIGKDEFVESEINNLSKTPEFKRALPRVLTVTIRIVYKQTIGEPVGESLENLTPKDLSQTEQASIVWNTESSKIQTIVGKLTNFIKTNDVLNNLTNFGVVIDNARTSKILSLPVKTLMYDYINNKITGLGEAKSTILSAINDNWTSENYSYTSLFATVETTAKVAKDLESMELTDMKDALSDVLNNPDVKNTISSAIENGVLDELIGNDEKAGVYKDIITSVLESDVTIDVEKELEAGQVIADIINKSSGSDGSSMFEDGRALEEASQAVDALANSEAVMKVIEQENQKSDEDSVVKGYIESMNESDKTAFETAIKGMTTETEADKNKQEALAELFGITL